MKTAQWPEKDPSEKVWLTFDYRQALEAGETIVSAAIAVTLKQGTDGNPAGILDGAVSLPVGRVLQRVMGGVSDASYLVRCSATTSSGRILLLAGIVPVREIS